MRATSSPSSSAPSAELASGTLVDPSTIRDAPAELGSRATLTSTCHLSGAFDGFDLAAGDPSDLDALVLRDLVREATVELRLDEA